MVDEDESVDLSFGLKGKVTVVTGGAAGIGAAIARAFVAKGARVALVDRDIDTARAHARNLGENVRAFQCDVADLCVPRISSEAVTRRVALLAVRP